MSLPPDITHLHLLTISEAASRLGTRRESLKDAITRGELTAYRTPGGERRVDAADVEALRHKREKEPQEPTMTTGEVAEFFGVSKVTVKRWQRAGRLHPIDQDRREHQYSATGMQRLWDRLNPDASR